ncbi:MAG: molybdopterin synthase sulfur carrier subunit [Flavobacteriales bacterium]|nr:MAG: molybdopterin synthase sulfur carrier subunit [Flavobacteriales bacterium]
MKLKYFGMTAEASGKDEELLDNNYSSVKELKADLLAKYPNLLEINFKVAVNQEIVNDDYKLSGNEEIALLPPFAGG